MSLEQNIPIVVREIREEKHISCAALGRAIGVSSGHMSQMETGKRGIPYDTLELISDALGVKASAIIRRAEKNGSTRL